ncbi:MAG: OmpA family protein [Fibrobacter sp.]|nr:OmpA family protein [Fibrobacter sp.]
MKFSKLVALCAIATAASFAEDEVVAPNLYDQCYDSLNAATATVPADAHYARLAVLEAMANAQDLKLAVEDDEESDESANLAAACFVHAKIIRAEVESYKLKENITNNLKKQVALNKSIESILEQIINAHSGKVSSLSANLAETSEAMKEQEARLQAESAALKAASEREAELQKREAELQKELEAERAKAEARQNEAMNKLNELQSKLIQVSKDARGIILSMSDILFDVNKATLKSDLKTSLAKVAGILSVYQQFNVSIEGNTDNTGSEEHNMKLSEQRATNVKNFLVEQGIDESRLTAKGLGMTMPIADNSTKEGRQKNRRVDLVIQDKALNANGTAK